jgi:RNA polymerase sigma-70 factor (ECF subfamily)
MFPFWNLGYHEWTMADAGDSPGPPPPGGGPLGETATLLQRARSGDSEARDLLFARFVPVLRRWAHRRLPSRARDLADTDDLVQVTLLRALRRLPHLESREEGSLLAYLRRILLNAVREEIRRSSRRGHPVQLSDDLSDGAAPEVERLIGRERLMRYEAALSRLSQEQQELVVLRIEFHYTFEQIAEATGRPSANAARMAFVRTAMKLAEAMDD